MCYIFGTPVQKHKYMYAASIRIRISISLDLPRSVFLRKPSCFLIQRMRLSLSHTLPQSPIAHLPLKRAPHRVLVILIRAPCCCHICLQKVSLHTKRQ